MRAADLKRAQALLGQRDVAKALADRITGGERLHFILGEGSGASEIVTAESFAKEIAGELRMALTSCVEHLNGELNALGVEP
jgi:hypothetical protein